MPATRGNTGTGNEPNKLVWQVAAIDCPKPQMLAVHPDGMVPMLVTCSFFGNGIVEGTRDPSLLESRFTRIALPAKIGETWVARWIAERDENVNA